MEKVKGFLICMVIIAGFACKELYKPAIISSPNSYLVIEGVLNAGTGPTSIRLTRTFKLDDAARLRIERSAQVIVEGKDNTTQQLIMNGDGFYSSPGLNLVLNQEYRLRIKTANGKEYLSDYVAAKKTPPIDSLGFKQDDKGVQVYVNTHDDFQDTRYYHWDYDETWEIRTYYHSNYKYVNGVVLLRGPDDNVSTCWKYISSSNILLGSSAHLQSDIIYRAPVTFIGNGDEKLAVRYSILLRQYALDKRGYEFYAMMKKNTESLGTIFDAQPSEIKGNVHCTSDPGELVIGYVSAAVIEEKRFFIARSELQQWRFYEDCPNLDILNHPDSISDAYAGGLSIWEAIYPPVGNRIARYYVSYAPCVECPKRGGSLLRPSYW
jgi:hypothetical protein